MLHRTVLAFVAVACLLFVSAGTASAYHRGGFHGGHHGGYHGHYHGHYHGGYGYRGGYGGGYRGGYGYGGYLAPVILPPPPVYSYPPVGGYGYVQPGCGGGYGYARSGFGVSSPGFGFYIR